MSKKDEKAAIKAAQEQLSQMKKSGWPMRSKRDRNNTRLSVRSVIMDELNNRGVKWWGKENSGLIDRLTEQSMGTAEMRSNVSLRLRVNAGQSSKANTNG